MKLETLSHLSVLNIRYENIESPVSAMQILYSIFPSSTFFSPVSFYPDFFLHFSPTFYPMFFYRWSHTSKGSFMDKSALTWPGFILGLHVTILFIAENVMYCSLTLQNIFLNNKAMLS